jgi:hypothetical protein
MRHPRHLLLILAALLAVLAAACGGGSSSDNASDDEDAVVVDDDGVAAFELVASSPDRLAEAHSARMQMVMRMSGLPAPMPVMEITAEGVTDLQTQDGVITMDLGSIAGIPMDAIEMRIVDGVIYMDFSSLMQSMPGATGLPPNVRWLKLDPTALVEELGMAPEDLGLGAQPTDFTQYLDQLRDVSRGVEEVGTEEIDGVSTTRYRAEIDLDKAYDAVPEQLRELVGNQRDALRGAHVPVDVWLDDDGLLRRMEYRFDAGSLGVPDGDASMTMTMNLSDFGVDVDVQAPPESETLDMLDLMGPGGLGAAA